MRDAAGGAAVPRARRRLARRPHRARTARPRDLVTPIWLVLPDPFSSRLFFDTGIVDALRARVGDRLELVLDAGEQTGALERACGRHAHHQARRSDDARTRRPRSSGGASIAGSTRGSASIRSRCGRASATGSTASACGPATRTGSSTPTRAGPLPRLALRSTTLMTSWHYGRLALRAAAAPRAAAAERPAIALANTADALGRPVRRRRAAYSGCRSSVTSRAGITPSARESLRRTATLHRSKRCHAGDLVRYHGIEPERIVVTGWPQTDVFHRRRPRERLRARRARARARSGPARRPRDGQHPDERAVRGAVRRAARRLVGRERRGSPLLAALPPAPARPAMARALRAGAAPRGGRGSGAELHRPRDARRAAPAR